MKIIYSILGTLIYMGSLTLTSCEEKGLLVNSNDISYLKFANDMTKDTTTVSFKIYNEGEDAVIPIEVSISGKVQDADLPFTVSVDRSRTTLPDNLFTLPVNCKIRKGLLTDTIYVTLKNDPMLVEAIKVLALQVDEEEGIKQGDRSYSRVLIAVTDKLFKPDWWAVNDVGSEGNFGNSADWYYLGEYMETKYTMFLDELKKDDMVFDGKNKQVLRKYALRLKNTLKELNAGKEEEYWVRDEKTKLIITVPVAG